jgi:hypothetical protein
MQLKIEQLERNLENDTVTAVHWDASLKDGKHSVRTYGTVSFNRDENSSPFIPFKDLTEAKVIEWVKAEWKSPEDTLIAEMAELKEPTKENGLPW